MEVLLISKLESDQKEFQQIFNETFRRLELKCLSSSSDAIEYIKKSQLPAFTICSVEDEDIERLKHCMGTRPVVMLKEEGSSFGHIDSISKVIQKPLESYTVKKTLLDVIKGLQQNAAPETIKAEERIPIKIKNFYRLRELPYDVYLELSKTKYIKIINKDEPFSSEVVQKYARKKVKYFYLKKKEHLEFLENTIVSLVQIFDTPNLSPQNSIMAQINAVQVIHEYVRTIGVNDKVIELTRKVIVTTERVYENLDGLKQIIIKFPFREKDVAEQAVLVSYICEGLLLKMGWKAQQTRLKVGLAAILHDSMLSNDDLAVITSIEDPNLAMFEQSEQEEFHAHPLRGAEIARDYEAIPEADFIIAQHHELPDGSGFPHKLSSHKIPTLSCVFIVANNFVGELCQKGLGAQEIATILCRYQNIYGVGNFRDPMQQLIRCFA